MPDKMVFARDVDGRTELVELMGHRDTVRIIADGKESVVGPHEAQRALGDFQAHGFVEVYPNDQRKMDAEKARILGLVRNAFRGVTLGEGVGLRQGQGLDDYADEQTLAAYRALDEKLDWSAISTADLDRYSSSLSFFDADGMRFHLPAFLVAELEGRAQSVYIVYHLTRLEDGAASRFDTLSPAQRDVVREFLLLNLSDAHQEFDHPNIEAALRVFWTAGSAS